MNRNSSRRLLVVLAFFSLLVTTVFASDYEPKPNDPYFAKFNPRLAPTAGTLLLKTGDRLAIVGDSITEQRRYSRILETYLTVCVPQLKISVRQFGWSGETAEGFRKRMDQDCLRFKPTIATFNYGMNDSRYRPYDDVNGEWYASNYTAIVRAFKVAGARVILGSPGCVGRLAPWANTPSMTMDEHNLNLCTLRDIDIRIAASEDVQFADVFWPMLKAEHEGELRYGTASHPFQLCGPDGVHPNWSGHLVMARSFLLAMGLDGSIGTFTVDLAANHAEATDGHKIDLFKNGELNITSTRYPFCDSGKTNDANSIRAGMSLVPFNDELNRLMLVVKNIGAPRCEIIWGSNTNIYSAEQLAAGINLANDFAVNPFSEAFKRVDDAVAAKQRYETRQIKQIFHGPEGKANIEAAVARTEKERAPLVKAISDALVPVHHTIRIVRIQ